MSADGYFRVPRRLATAAISPERVAALLWITSQASFAPRVVEGVALEIGETPCIPASAFERRYKWTRKATRVFLDYVLSDRCAQETGIRLRIGKKFQGPAEGPALGPSKGPTYLVRLHKVTGSEGPAEGPALGPAEGQPVVNNKEEERKKTDMGHKVARARHDYEQEFEAVWEELPKRSGNNPKINAAHAYRARRKEGVAHVVLLSAAKAYRAFCDATSLTGTAHTMQAQTFFGPGKPFEQEWPIPLSNGNGNGRKKGELVLDSSEVERVSAAISARSTESTDELPWRGR